MSSRQNFIAGVLREQWTNAGAGDPAPAGYTAWNAQGGVTSTRALSAAESTALAAADVQTTTDANGRTLRSRIQAALTANANLQAAVAPTVGSLAGAQTAVNTIWAAMQIQSKELSALVYLALNQFDSTSGT